MLDAYRELIDELLTTPAEVRSLTATLGDMDVPPEAMRLIAELRDRDRTMLARLQTMTQTETPYLQRLRLETVDVPDVPSQLLDEVDSARGDLVSALINLSLKDWERMAIHETEGEVTVADEIEAHVEFDEELRRRLRELFLAER